MHIDRYSHISILTACTRDMIVKLRMNDVIAAIRCTENAINAVINVPELLDRSWTTPPDETKRAHVSLNLGRLVVSMVCVLSCYPIRVRYVSVFRANVYSCLYLWLYIIWQTHGGV